jgi:hypothetical protein
MFQDPVKSATVTKWGSYLGVLGGEFGAEVAGAIQHRETPQALGCEDGTISDLKL